MRLVTGLTKWNQTMHPNFRFLYRLSFALSTQEMTCSHNWQRLSNTQTHVFHLDWIWRPQKPMKSITKLLGPLWCLVTAGASLLEGTMRPISLCSRNQHIAKKTTLWFCKTSLSPEKMLQQWEVTIIITWESHFKIWRANASVWALFQVSI